MFCVCTLQITCNLLHYIVALETSNEILLFRLRDLWPIAQPDSSLNSKDSKRIMQFQGGVFSEAIPGGRSGVEITIKTYELHATTPDGSEFRLPFTDIQFERGGSSGKMIFCRNEDRSLTIFCEKVMKTCKFCVSRPREVTPGRTFACRIRFWGWNN